MKAFLALARQHLRENRVPLLLWAAMSALMSVVVAGTAPVMSDEQLMREFIAQLPAPAQSLIGHPDSYASVLDYYVAFKWLGLMPLVGSVFGATAAMGVMARDIERRTADFPLSLPVSRACLLGARFAAVALGLLLVYSSAFAALWLRMITQGSEGSFGRYGLHFVACYCLSLAFAGVGLLLSLTVRRYGLAARSAVFVAVGAFLLDALNRLLHGPSFLGWISLYGLARTEDTIGKGLFPIGAVTFGLGIAMGLLWLSIRVFAKKQIPA